MAIKWRAVLQLQDHDRPVLALVTRDRQADALEDAREVIVYVNDDAGYFWVPVDAGEHRIYSGNVRGYHIERVHTGKHLGIEWAADLLLDRMADAEMDDGNLPQAVIDAMDNLHQSIGRNFDA